MIKTIKELVRYSKKKAKMLPQLKERILIQTPGYQADEINMLKNDLANFNNDFIKILEQIKLDGISITYFNFSSINENYLDSIRKLNSHESGYWDFLNKYDMYQVASFETDLICYSNQGKIMIKKEDSNDPIYLSKNFEIFLLTAINLDEILSESNENIDSDMEKFQAVLSFFNFTEEQKREWLEIGNYILSE